MPYPKRIPGENTNSESMSTAPVRAQTQPVIAPRTPSATGGAPVVKKSMRPLWQSGTPGIPAPPAMTLAQSQTQLKSLTGQLRNRFDATLAQNPNVIAQNPRFWRAYQEFPDGVAAMMARRVHTDQIVGSGPVADYMKFLEGMGR
jgi:hypothetical protein